jgi:hypothetical protein
MYFLTPRTVTIIQIMPPSGYHIFYPNQYPQKGLISPGLGLTAGIGVAYSVPVKTTVKSGAE